MLMLFFEESLIFILAAYEMNKHWQVSQPHLFLPDEIIKFQIGWVKLLQILSQRAPKHVLTSLYFLLKIYQIRISVPSHATTTVASSRCN